MTLSGQKNHYNVKFLKGYGHSISVKNSKIILKNCADPFSPPDIEEWFVKQIPYHRIVLSGKGYLSTEALGILSENNCNLILVDVAGSPLTFLSPLKSSYTATKYRIGQYDTFRDGKKREHLTRQIIQAKLESQIRFLKLLNRSDATKTISVLTRNIQLLREGLDPKKIEATSANVYFRYYASLFDARFGFSSRNSILISKKDASDVINGLLNYGYAVLASQIAKFVNGIGLDPYYGFYHANHTSFQALVYDVMEPFRWLVEYTVWKISDAKNRSRISKKQYFHTRQGHVVLEYKLIRVFLEMLERTFQMKRRYDYKFGLKTSDGLKSVQEITIAKITIQNIAEFCCRKNVDS